MKVNLAVHLDNGQVLKLWWLESDNVSIEEVRNNYLKAIKDVMKEKALIHLFDQNYKVYVIDTAKVSSFEIDIN